MAALFALLKRTYTAWNPPASPPLTSPIKFGILGAAKIAPGALILPASNHPETVVYAVAARNRSKAEAYAKKYGIGKVYSGPSGYQELLNDPQVDVLPNGLHYEWTMKALAAGKHVLLEKPSANTAEETRLMFDLAERKGLVLLEAFHYRFHPDIGRVKAILDSGELGPIKNISASCSIPDGLIKKGDIRFDYEIGGGAMMDMGCYSLDCMRFLTSSTPISVLTATPTIYSSPSPNEQLVDLATNATLAFPNDVTATLVCHLAAPWWGPFNLIPSLPDFKVKVECEKGEVELFNYILPVYYHWIRVRVKDENRKGSVQERVEKYYKPKDKRVGEEWWTTYRYQLEAFVDRVKGRTPATWITKEDSVENMEWVEKIYDKTGLGSRPKSLYVYSE